MATQTESRRWTANEWAEEVTDIEPRADAAGIYDRELVDGVEEEGEVVRIEHAIVVQWFIRALAPWVGERGGLLGTQQGLRLTADTVRIPDLVLWSERDQLHPYTGLQRERPALVIEVLSHRLRDIRRDRETKSAEYARFGIPNYWIVNPVGRSVEFYQLGDEGEYERVLHAYAIEQLTEVPGCPELTLDLAALWRELDQLQSEE